MTFKKKAIVLLAIMALSITSMISVSAYHAEVSDYYVAMKTGKSHALTFTSNFAEAETLSFAVGDTTSYGTGKFTGTKGGLTSADTVKTEAVGKSNATQVAAVATAYTDMSTEQVGKTSVTATQKGPLWKSATPTGHACTTNKDSSNNWLTVGVNW